MKEFKFEISDKSYNILLKIYNDGYIKYDNTDDKIMAEIMSPINELVNCELIYYDYESNYLTYKITKFGKKLIKDN